MKVLVAEDNGTMRIMVAGVLARWGHQAVTAADGEEAWRIMQQPDAPRIAILDWEMPGIDGVEVCRRLRARESEGANYTYAILLTSHSEKNEIISGIEAGADDYVVKPFNQHELRARVRTGSRIIELQMELLQSKEEYRRLSRTDPLTGCLNRRAILDRVAEKMQLAKNEGTMIGVSMMDLDHFKHVNDAHGHAAGDMILCEFVTRLGAIMRSLIEEEPFQTTENNLSITVSIGVTATAGNETVDAAIARADRALYAAKESGRNRVKYDFTGFFERSVACAC
jgi:PleD family two-component response regulator